MARMTNAIIYCVQTDKLAHFMLVDGKRYIRHSETDIYRSFLSDLDWIFICEL